MQHTADDWIALLGLTPHPEGGYFRETYRADESIPAAALPERYGGARPYATTIYYLLQNNDFSALHRLASDETWHFYGGAPLAIHIIDTAGNYRIARLGNNPQNGESFQVVVGAGCWFGATVTGPDGYTLAGCTVAPGFDFADFEIADRQTLIRQHPALAHLITNLTRR